MTISELITHLAGLHDRYGDVEVYESAGSYQDERGNRVDLFTLAQAPGHVCLLPAEDLEPYMRHTTSDDNLTDPRSTLGILLGKHEWL